MENNILKLPILVLGAQGNLGSQIVKCLEEVEGIGKIIAWNKTDCNVLDFQTLSRKINELHPTVVINTVAYNNVDLCESDLTEQKKAIELNVLLVDNLVQICKGINAKLVHFSTNYVFSGEEQVYMETSIPAPINFYGMTKELGEQIILNQLAENLQGCIIRVSNLFGAKGISDTSKPNFFDVIKNAAEEKEDLSIVDNEACCFTYTKDVANSLKQLLLTNKFEGIYHFVNSEAVTWFEAAKIYFELLHKDVSIIPVKGENFGRPAKRPKTAILNSTRTPPMRSFRLALEEYIQEDLKDLNIN